MTVTTLVLLMVPPLPRSISPVTSPSLVSSMLIPRKPRRMVEARATGMDDLTL
jgi:hypothetical protein